MRWPIPPHTIAIAAYMVAADLARGERWDMAIMTALWPIIIARIVQILIRRNSLLT